MGDRVIFWDFDGTLSHPNRAFTTALYDALIQEGYTPNKDETLNFLEHTYPWKTPMADHSAMVGEHWWTVFFEKIDAFCRAQGMEIRDSEKLHSAFRQTLIRVQNYRLYEDTVDTLRTCLQMGYTNYLLTNNYPEIVDTVVALGIDAFFKGFIVSSHVGFDKPRQELYTYAKSLAGDPRLCYMIGDNPVADIGGGNSAGMKTIYVHNGALDTAYAWVDQLREIPAILE